MNIALKVAIGILAFLGVVLIALAIYYFPVLDRLVFRTCHYYPDTFSDCR